MRGLRREQPHEPVEVAPQQRLAAGETHLVHAEVGEDVDERGHLLEGEDVVAGQPDVLLLGHAVLAAQVAAVGDREPQVAQRAIERVADHGSST